jgi:TetR/AcrR family acrAB operon transcriptional repressor
MAKSGNQEREQRILDAAANLFAHYGYDKTAVSDIARDAGISQGAIYLHFESKDDLLEALLIRELRKFAESWHESVQADPDGGTIAGLYKNMLYTLHKSGFMSAMFKQDRRVFGSYLRKPDNFFRRSAAGGEQGGRYAFVKMMQDAGLVRPEINPKVAAHIMNILAYGLVGMDDIVPETDIPPLDALIEGIADFMHRALTPEGGGDSEAGKVIIRELFAAGRQQLIPVEDAEQSE